MSAFNQMMPTHIQTPLPAYSGTYQGQPSTPMVHTPYSCEHDLVPTCAEPQHYYGGSTSSMRGDEEDATQEMGLRVSSNGSLGPNSTIASAVKPSRRNSPNPVGQSASAFDPWSGQTSFHQQNNETSEHVVDSQHCNTNTQNFPAFMMRAPIVNAPVHSAHLGGRAEYLEMPPAGAEITTAAQWNRQYKVFVGHVKFEISPDGLRWLIYMLTGVQAGKIEVRGMGCFMVFFASTDEVFRVRGLHKRVLFDSNGIWFAQNQDQEEYLHHYANNVAPGVHAKLPKGLMVVDEETSRRRNKKNSNGNNSKNHSTAATPKNAAIVPAAFHVDQSQSYSTFSQQQGPAQNVTASIMKQVPAPLQAVTNSPTGFQCHTALSSPAHPVQSAAELWASQRRSNSNSGEY